MIRRRRRRRRLPSYDDDQNIQILSNLRSNQIFDIPLPNPTPLDLLVANIYSHKTTAMTTRQFNGLLSILDGLLALFFQDFFMCNANHLLS